MIIYSGRLSKESLCFFVYSTLVEVFLMNGAIYFKSRDVCPRTVVLLFCTFVLFAFFDPDYLSPPEEPGQPMTTIEKSRWTSAGLAFAPFPLCILLVLKGLPFVLFSYWFLTQLHIDKLAWLHRWSARLI